MNRITLFALIGLCFLFFPGCTDGDLSAEDEEQEVATRTAEEVGISLRAETETIDTSKPDEIVAWVEHDADKAVPESDGKVIWLRPAEVTGISAKGEIHGASENSGGWSRLDPNGSLRMVVSPEENCPIRLLVEVQVLLLDPGEDPPPSLAPRDAFVNDFLFAKWDNVADCEPDPDPASAQVYSIVLPSGIQHPGDANPVGGTPLGLGDGNWLSLGVEGQVCELLNVGTRSFERNWPNYPGAAASVGVIRGVTVDILVTGGASSWTPIPFWYEFEDFVGSQLFTSGALKITVNADNSAAFVTGVDEVHRVTIDETSRSAVFDRVFSESSVPGGLSGLELVDLDARDDRMPGIFRDRAGNAEYIAFDRSGGFPYSIRSRIDTTGEPVRAAWGSDFGFVTFAEGRIEILDRSDPTDLAIVSTTPVSGMTGDVGVVRGANGDYFCYCPTNDGVFCLRTDSSGTTIRAGMLQLPVAGFDFCCAHQFADGTRALLLTQTDEDRVTLVMAGDEWMSDETPFD